MVRACQRSLPVIGTGTALLALALALWLLPVARTPARISTDSVLPWWGMAIAVILCELVVLRLQVRREAHAVSLSELAVVLGLFLATPSQFLIGRMLGGFLVFAVGRRQAAVKVYVNCALFLLESTAALAVFHAVLGGESAVGPRAWGAAASATATLGALSAVIVTLVIAIVDGELRPRDLLSEPLEAAVTSVAVSSAGLVAVHSLIDGPVAWAPLVAAFAFGVLAFRAYSGLSERHLSLERLYRFSHAVGRSPEVNVILTGVLEHACDVLRAERAELVLLHPEPPGGPQALDLIQGRLRRRRLPPEQAADPLWRRVVQTGEPLLVQRGRRDPAIRAFLLSRGLRDAVLAPVRGDAGLVGTLLVGDRMGEVRTFDEDDVHLLVTVANHAGMALRNGQLVDQLRHDALHDSLTGLPNRTMLTRALNHALGEMRAGVSLGAVVMIMDLVGFKQVNDTLGHHLGDLLLREVGRRFARTVGRSGTLARLGGDEFAVVLPGVAGTEPALEVGRRLQECIQVPVQIEGTAVAVGVSIGVSVAPLHGTDGPVLMKRADAAMYEAKGSGAGLRLFEVGLEADESREQLALVAELRQGVFAGELAVHVQPQAALPSGAIEGAEALVRWHHPRRGLLLPDEFITLAERTGLMRAITLEVLDLAIGAAGRWREAGQHLNISVNLSARSTITDDTVDAVAALLQRYGVPPSELTLEITESSIIRDPTRTRAVLDRLHAMGIRLSIDDFGTGYSSLSYLRQLPVQEVKIDRSFVMNMLHEPDDEAIVRTIVELAHHLGLRSVAEGVEDAATLIALAEMGCDLVQGYHVAQPMPLEDFPRWLSEHRSAITPTAGALPAHIERPPSEGPVPQARSSEDTGSQERVSDVQAPQGGAPKVPRARRAARHEAPQS